MLFAGKKADRRGATAVELALVLVPFFLFVFGTMEFGRLILTQHSLTCAARVGARLAALNTDVNGDDVNHLTSADIEDAIRPLLENQGIQNLTVDIYHIEAPDTDWAANATLQHRIAVDVEADYRPLTPVFSLVHGGNIGTIPVSAQSVAHSEGH